MQKNPFGFLTHAIQGGKRKTSLIFLLTIAVIVSGVFIYTTVFAVDLVTPASGGINISLDTSSQAISPSWTTLGPITLTETVRKQIAAGQHTFTLPIGWEFDTESTIVRGSNGGESGIDFVFTAAPIPSANSFSVWIQWYDDGFSAPGVISLSNLRVRPTTDTPTTEVQKILHTTGTLTLPDVDANTSFGDLSTVAGADAQIRVETSADGSGSVFSAQSFIAGASTSEFYAIVRDQFGNFKSNSDPDSWTVTSGTGGLTDPANYTFTGGASATFSATKVGEGLITPVKGSLTSVDSGLVTVTPAAPDEPTAADGPLINGAEETAGFDVVVPLGSSGAIEGDTLELLLDGASFTSSLTRVLDATDITNGNYTFNVVTGQLGLDGAKGITAQVTDNSNTGPQSSVLELMLDTEVPADYTVNIDTDPINNQNYTNFTFTFAGAEVDAIYNYSIDDTNGDTAAITGSGTIVTETDQISNIDVSTLDDDTLTLTVTLTDPAGNTGANAIDTVIKDTVAPVVTEVTPVTNPINTLTPSYTFNSTEAGTITYGGSCSSATSDAIVGGNTIVFSTLAETAHNDCTITVTDATGNVSDVLDISDFTVDVTPPTVELSTALDEPTNTSPIPVTAEFSEDVTGFIVNDIAVGNGAAGNFVAVDGNTYTFDITPAGQGAVTVDANASVAQDAALNNNIAATQLSRTYDNVPPAQPADSDITPNLNTSVAINATTDSTATITGTVEASVTVEMVVDDTPNGITTTADGGGLFTFTNANLVLAGIVGGSDYGTAKVVKLKISDAATNNITTTNGISYTRDTTIPTVSVNSLTTNDTTPELTGTIDDASATIQVTVNSSGYSATNNGDGTWTLVDNTITALGEETYDVAVTATDGAGNVGSDSTTDELVVDTTLPTVALTYNPASPVGPGTVTITATYSEPVASTPQISIDQQGTTDISNAAMTDSGDQTVWTYDYTVNADYEGVGAYVDGTATVSLSTVADPAGNNAAAPSGNTFVIDSGAPTLTIDAPLADSVTKTIDGTVTLATTIDETATCEYKINSGDYHSTVCDGDIVDAALTDGRHILYIKATDGGGNFTEESVSIVIDANDTLSVASSDTDFTTIQEAIDKATAGDTINVAAGTYAETVTIDKQLVLQGAGDATIINPVIDTNGINITADNVTVKDLKVVTSSTGSSNIAISIDGTTGVTIDNNVVETTGNTAMGVWIGNNASNNLTLTKNTITIAGEATGIYAAKVASAHTGWIIGGGSLANANTVIAENGNPLELYDVSASEVSYNTLTTSAAGGSAVIWSSETVNLSNLIFNYNTVDYSGGSQVAFMEDFQDSLGTGVAPDTTITTVTITGNTFTNWGSRGLRIGADVAGVTINTNNFVNGTGEAIKNESINILTMDSNTFSDFTSNTGYPTVYNETAGGAGGGVDNNPVGALDADASTVTVTSPVAADGTTEATVTITAIGNNGNKLSGITASDITFTVSGNDNTLTQPSADTDGDGITTGKITSTKAENKTIVVTIDDVELSSHPVANFIAGAIDHYVITSDGGVIGDQVAGITFDVTIQAQDVNDNNIGAGHADAVETVNIIFSEADGVATPVSVDTTDGAATASMTMTVVQTGQTLTFTGDTSGMTTGASNAFDVSPGALDHFTVTGIDDPIVAGIQASPVVTAYDEFNNTKTDYVGTIVFTSTDGQAIFPSNYTFIGGDSGTHTFTNGVTLKTAGEQTVTVADGDSSGSQTVTVHPAAIATLIVETAPGDNPITTTETSEIIVTGKDAYGNIVTNDTTTELSLSLPVGSGFVQELTPTAGTLTSGVFNSILTPINELPSASVTVSVKAETTNLGSNINGVLSGGLVVNDGTAPQVTTSPSVGDSNVLRTVQPVLTFSETMATSTFSNIKLRYVNDPDDEGLLNADDSITVDVVVVNDTQARIEPDESLDYLTDYYYYIPSTVTDVNGVPFVAWDASNKSSHTFTTENHELEAPYVTNWSPADNSKDMPVDTNIILNFNEKLDQTGITSKFKLRPYTCTNDTCNVPITVTYNDSIKQITINPNSNLSYGQQYYIYVVSTLKDLVGNEFGSSWQDTGDDESQHEFTTIQGMTVQVYAEKTDGSADNYYVNGWRYRYEMTLNTDENALQVKFPTGWTSEGGGSIPTEENMRLMIDESSGGQITGLWDENLIINGEGSKKSYALLANDYFTPPSNISTLDSNDNLDDGRQIIFYVFTKIPTSTSGGIYTADYVIETSNYTFN